MSLDKRKNNFDLLRLAASISVLVSHAFTFTGRIEPNLGPGESLGAIAVFVFFGISGYLITNSWSKSPKLIRFVQKRALRILPAYVVALLMAAFVVGPLATDLPLGSYFTRGETFTFVATNLTFWHNYYALPGVFVHNPYPFIVNGSIWTITYEIRAYVLVAMLGLAGLLQRRRWLALCWVLIIVAATKTSVAQLLLGHSPTLFTAFATGSIISALGERLPLRWDLAAGGLLLWELLSGSSRGVWLAAVVVPYAAIVVAYRTPRSWSRLVSAGDFSYGIYLWAFPVEQLLAQIHGLSPWTLIALSLPMTYALGAASWLLVEKRALRYRVRSVKPGQAASATPDSALSVANS